MSNVTCPKCISANTCRIVYGLMDLTPELEQKLEAGNIYLGGCEITEDDPNRHCNNCKLDFNTNDPNIYLDIDGVLLANDLTPANYAKEFLIVVLGRFPYNTYWLTTHCNGDASVPIKHIGHLFDSETIELMRKIKPTTWDMANKTLGIDFTKPFLWFDDDLFYDEKQVLTEHNALDNWIEVNLSKNPDQLAQFIASFPIP